MIDLADSVMEVELPSHNSFDDKVVTVLKDSDSIFSSSVMEADLNYSSNTNIELDKFLLSLVLKLCFPGGNTIFDFYFRLFLLLFFKIVKLQDNWRRTLNAIITIPSSAGVPDGSVAAEIPEFPKLQVILLLQVPVCLSKQIGPGSYAKRRSVSRLRRGRWGKLKRFGRAEELNLNPPMELSEAEIYEHVLILLAVLSIFPILSKYF